MFKRIPLLATILCLPVLPLMAETTELQSPAKAATLEKYTNTEKHYSIEYPSTWKRNDVPQLDIVLFAPSKSEDPHPRASLNIVSENIGTVVPLEVFYTESVNNLKETLKEVNVEKTGTSTLNGTESKWIIYTHVMQNVKFRVLQYFVASNQTVYLITFGAIAEDFNNYRTEFETIVSSFRINKP